MIESFDRSLVSPIKTAEMEQKLSDIATGSLDTDKYTAEIQDYIKDTVAKVLNTNTTKISTSVNAKNYKCPCCKEILKYGQYGYYCSCKYSIAKEICKSKITEKDVDNLLTKGMTDVKKFTSNAGKKFEARLVVNVLEHKNEFEFVNRPANKMPVNRTSRQERAYR